MRIPGDTRISEGRPQTWARRPAGRHGGMFEGNEYSTVTLVRDTPETRRALELIRSSMLTMSGRLSELFAQDNIESTLQRVLSHGSPLALGKGTD